LHVGQDPICVAEQKEGAFWRRIALYFHENRKFLPINFESDWNDMSLAKRWGFMIGVQQILWNGQTCDPLKFK
jgi:hypothetical protein